MCQSVRSIGHSLPVAASSSASAPPAVVFTAPIAVSVRSREAASETVDVGAGTIVAASRRGIAVPSPVAAVAVPAVVADRRAAVVPAPEGVLAVVVIVPLDVSGTRASVPEASVIG